MIRKHLTAAAMACAVAGAPASAMADHYMASADPQVVQAITEIIQVLGQACNMGNGQACNAIPLAQQQAHVMLSAGYDCQRRNQQACAFYQQNLWQLQAAYQQTAMAVQSGALMQNRGGGAGMGLTHEERMQQIHAMGQASLDYGRQVSDSMDRSHQQFMEYLRQ